MEIKSEVYKHGRVTIPIKLRKELDIKEGDEIIFVFRDGELRLMTHKLALHEAKRLLKKELQGEPVSLVDELLKDRKKEYLSEY